MKKTVENRKVRMLIIDSLNGYLNAMPSEPTMIHVHELLMFLGRQGVVTLLVMAQHGMMGSAMRSPVDVSFLADTVVLLRYFEAMGEVRQAISVVRNAAARMSAPSAKCTWAREASLWASRFACSKACSPVFRAIAEMRSHCSRNNRSGLEWPLPPDRKPLFLSSRLPDGIRRSSRRRCPPIVVELHPAAMRTNSW